MRLISIFGGGKGEGGGGAEGQAQAQVQAGSVLNSFEDFSLKCSSVFFNDGNIVKFSLFSIHTSQLKVEIL